MSRRTRPLLGLAPETCVAGAGERGQVRVRASADEQPGGPVRHPEPAREPVQQHELDLRGAAACRPCALEEMGALRNQLTEDSRPGRAAGNEGQEARVVDVARKGQHVRRQAGSRSSSKSCRAARRRLPQAALELLPRRGPAHRAALERGAAGRRAGRRPGSRAGASSRDRARAGEPRPRAQPSDGTDAAQSSGQAQDLAKPRARCAEVTRREEAERVEEQREGEGDREPHGNRRGYRHPRVDPEREQHGCDRQPQREPDATPVPRNRVDPVPTRTRTSTARQANAATVAQAAPMNENGGMRRK